MDGPREDPPEGSKSEKEKYHLISLICGLQKEMTQMNLFTKQKQIHRFREGTFGRQKKNGGKG